MSADLIYHGIRREIFAAPLGRESLRFLRGEVLRPCFYDWPAEFLAQQFLERWFYDRAKRKPEFRQFERDSYRLWQTNGMVVRGGNDNG